MTKVPAVGWAQYTIFMGLCDLWFMHQVPENPPGKLCTRLFGEEATNYEYGFLGIPGYLGGKAISDPEAGKSVLFLFVCQRGIDSVYPLLSYVLIPLSFEYDGGTID